MTRSKQIASYLNENKEADPVSRLAGVSGILGLCGKELTEVLESTKLIHLFCAEGGMSVLLAPDSGFEAIRKHVIVCLEQFPKEKLDIDQTMSQLLRGGMEEIMENGGSALLPTNFGGMIITASPIPVIEAIRKWNLPPEPEDDSYWLNEDDFLKVLCEVEKRLKSDPVVNVLPDDAISALARELAKNIHKLEAFYPKPNAFDIAAWLDAAENEPDLSLGVYLKRAKCPCLEFEVVAHRHHEFACEIAFSNPKWHNAFDALLEREVHNPLGGWGWQDVDLVYDALSRICWDVFGKYNYIYPEWPKAEELAWIFSDRDHFRVNFGQLGPKGRR